jgi:hypothetical protein
MIYETTYTMLVVMMRYHILSFSSILSIHHLIIVTDVSDVLVNVTYSFLYLFWVLLALTQ